ncbi:hypothetical protein AVEN_264419-1 [Araneus ventricosus]|uniref:Uncharacterized protein n=1 Tax=Araneus ventricosus TaxID=182803 RepID=A0A4Y2HTQ6_ARAVE|nr:hypothetical protein AVEN_264419-1 [Araneus ventricosus]
MHFGRREGKNNRHGRKPMENSIAAGKNWIPKQTQGSSCAESLVGPFARVVDTSNDLTRSEPCDEGSKSEIGGVRVGIGGMQLYRTLELRVNDVPDFSTCMGEKKTSLDGKWMEWNTDALPA